MTTQTFNSGSKVSQVAEQFGKYILLEKLAMGGMAEVYLAKSTGASGVNKFIAIKRILPQFSENPEFIDMFKDEAKIAVNLSHSNIVSIFEFGVERSQFFLVMDYVEGRNLRQILNKMKKSNLSFSVEQVLYVIKEVAAGLDHAHRCFDANTGKPLNIIHRDMSPQNVMVSFEGEVKIVDFGIAKAETQIESTRAGTLKGKFGYMSPEQAEGQSVDLRTDIFSLGIVLWELLANDRLFVANNEINTLRKIRDCQIPSLRKINPNIPQELERICNKALARDRNLRYQTAAAFHRELNRFLNRQYPDFSPHDFSVFVKTLFASEILDNRKKQIEYAKIEGRPSAQIVAEPPTSITDKAPLTRPPERSVEPVDKTAITNTNTTADIEIGEVTDPSLSPNFTASHAVSPHAPAPAPQSADSLPSFDTLGKEKIEVKKPKIAPPPRPTSYADTNLRLEKRREGSYHQRSETYVGNTYNGTFVGTRSGIPKAKSSAIVMNFMIMVIVSTIGTVGYFAAFYPETSRDKVNAFLCRAQLISCQIPSETNQASEAKDVLVSIWSTPPGAEIIIDDRPHRDLTPAIISLKDGTEYSVTLRMNNHVQWTQRFRAKEKLSIGKDLQRLRVGYLDVSVQGSGEIFVDGKKVADAGPLQNLAIPADTDVRVQAIDPKTKAIAESIVRVSENKVKKINLFPRAIPVPQPPKN